ncbi:MAG: CRISPR-associated endonuclease Cas1 [Actinomycetota bacterium]|nr:CRISPR-associated endonuclease Cas1 [Actinomycetota bacterium]
MHTVIKAVAHIYRAQAYKFAIIVDGYGVSLTVDRGHLTIRDGIGTLRRTRKLTRSQRTVKRIVILGEAGTLSLAAVRWCTDTGITLVQLDSAGRTLLATVGDTPREARLRRAHALSTTSPTGLQVAQYLVGLKISGHAFNLTGRFHTEGQDTASRLHDLAIDIPATASIVELRDLEARAANLYFGVWARTISVTFATRDAARVPEHWRTGNPRTPRHQKYARRRASDPVNALLNYAYKLAEIECRIACIAVGLDPTSA